MNKRLVTERTLVVGANETQMGREQHRDGGVRIIPKKLLKRTGNLDIAYMIQLSLRCGESADWPTPSTAPESTDRRMNEQQRYAAGLMPTNWNGVVLTVGFGLIHRRCTSIMCRKIRQETYATAKALLKRKGR